MAISKFDLSSIFKIEGEEKSVGSKDGSLLKKKKKKKKKEKCTVLAKFNLSCVITMIYRILDISS